MPIYEYRCNDCGFQKDHLQKLADAPIATCPSCGSQTYSKLLSAAGFQLKGSGWYATDFKGSGKPASTGKAESTTAEPAKAEAAKSDAAAPAGGCGTSCACH